MVVLNNDYIFLPKTKKDDSRISSKDTDDTIRIQARKNVLLYIGSTEKAKSHNKNTGI